MSSLLQKEEQKHSVLIIESNKKLLKNMQYVFAGIYKTKIVFSIDEAIEEFDEGYRPDLILSNSEFVYTEDFAYLPEKIHGFELLDFLKSSKDEEVKNTPVIFVISPNNHQEMTALLERGAVDIVYNPINYLELYSRIDLRIEKSLERKKLSSSLKNIMEDMRNRNKKNLDFRTQIFSKHKEAISKYENEISQLQEEVVEKRRETEMLKINLQNLSRENNELFNELNFLRVKKSSAKKMTDNTTSVSLDDLKDNEVDAIERIYGYINKNYLFEEELIKVISDKILQSEIDFKKMDNFNFINNVIKIVKKFTREELMVVSQQSEASRFRERLNKHIEGLLEYIAKNHINKYLFYFAVKLLEVVGTKDETATRFLRFYDGRVEIGPNGVRYQKPVIGGKENSWNMVTIMQIINQRANGYTIVQEQEENIKKFNEQVNSVLAKVKQIATKYKSLLDGKIQKDMNPEQTIEVLESILKNAESSAEVEKDLETVEVLGMDYNRIKDEKKGFVAKYAKQVAYYKPTEEKFAKVASSLSKVMLKVKVV
ncbi:response regulator containing a CheY-like receiver domain and a GGDEF domain [Thiovulum sp. ES]|nr:response regulator containing a CheY-like receiver domain and a GGDEF domain [Thiovulum sp. ES]